MEYIAQFVITFTLAWATVYSLKRWTQAATAVFGILAMPLLIIVFAAGDGSSFWQILGSGMGIAITGTINAVAELTKAAPVMTAGALIGTAHAAITN